MHHVAGPPAGRACTYLHAAGSRSRLGLQRPATRAGAPALTAHRSHCTKYARRRRAHPLALIYADSTHSIAPTDGEGISHIRFVDPSLTIFEDDDPSFSDPPLLDRSFSDASLLLFDTIGGSSLVDPETLFVDTPVIAREDVGY